MGYDMSCLSEDRCENNYFRANIWGMDILRNAMDAAGILDWETYYTEGPDNDKDEDEDKYEQRIRAFRSSNEGMVPGAKFCSNDGWHVTPEECIIIFNGISAYLENDNEIVREIMEEDNINFVKEFAEYCRHSSECGGFRVW